MRVVITFLLLFAIGYAAFVGLTSSGALTPLDNLFARGGSLVIAATGVPVALTDGNQIVLPKRIMIIDGDCTALPLFIMFSALVLAYPVAPSARLKGLLIGLGVLVGANLIRLAILGNVSFYADDAFDTFHTVVMPIMMDVALLTAWLMWLTRVKGNAR